LLLLLCATACSALQDALVPTVLAEMSAAQVVCTEQFRASLTSFFVEKDTTMRFAQDQSDLCELCAKIIRLGYLYANDLENLHQWSDALQNNACSYVAGARKADCLKLTKGIAHSQRVYFTSSKAKFTSQENRATERQLQLLVDSKAYAHCKQLNCCRVIPKFTNRAVLSPSSSRGDATDLEKDRALLQKDRFALDHMRDSVVSQRRTNNEREAQLELHSHDLSQKEAKLTADRNTLAVNQEALRKNVETEVLREEAERRREDNEARREASNAEKERALAQKQKDLSAREKYVAARESAVGVSPPPQST